MAARADAVDRRMFGRGVLGRSTGIEDMFESVGKAKAEARFALDKMAARIEEVPEIQALRHGTSKGAPSPKLSFSDKVVAALTIVGSTAFLGMLAVIV